MACEIQTFYSRRMRLEVEQTQPVIVHIPEQRFSMIDYQLLSPTSNRLTPDAWLVLFRVIHKLAIQRLEGVGSAIPGYLNWCAGRPWGLPEF